MVPIKFVLPATPARVLTAKETIFSYVKERNPRFICMDGFSISIQASRGHYSTPRNDTGPYTHVECAYPSMPVSDAMKEYADDSSRYDTIYVNVPIAIVEAEIALHGGMLK